MKFVWNRSKAEINWQKHGVSFDEASTVFDDRGKRISLTRRILKARCAIFVSEYRIRTVSCSFLTLNA